MKKFILLLISLFLLSCGARKSEVNKSETKKELEENTVTTTKEEIKETVTTETEGTISIPEKVVEAEKPLADITDGKPLVYEDENIKSETYYDANTGNIKSKTTQKPKEIPVKQKEVAERVILRDKAENKQLDYKETTISKDKETDREASYNWIWWIVGAFVVIYIILFIWRKYKERHYIK